MSANIFAGIELGGAGSANDGLAGLNAIVTGNGSAALTFYTRDSNTFAEKMRITSGGDVFINNSSGVTLNDLTNRLSVSSTTYNLFDISRFSDNTFGPNFYLVKSRNGSIGGNTIVANGDNLGNINWVGANGTGFTDAASIKAEVDGTPGASDMPGRLVFSTTADGTTNNTERMRITSDGYVRLTSSSGGIQFNGDTSADNALDDYEEGAWTPVVKIGTTTNTGTGRGRYTKIGNVVYIQATITSITKSGTGGLTVEGLPFTVGTSGTFGDVQGTLRFQNITSSGVIYPYFNSGFTRILMQDFSSTGYVDTIQDTQISSTYQLYGISGFYMV
jgi:hypothetical protein